MARTGFETQSAPGHAQRKNFPVTLIDIDFIAVCFLPITNDLI